MTYKLDQLLVKIIKRKFQFISELLLFTRNTDRLANFTTQ